MWTVDTLAISVALKPFDHHNVVMTTKNIIAVRKIVYTTTMILSNWFQFSSNVYQVAVLPLYWQRASEDNCLVSLHAGKN